MSELLQKANAFVRENHGKVNKMYYPAYHLAPPVGWINDPNGFCFYRGQYHLFAQYHPYDSVWGPMHWAHWVSEDLIRWTWMGVALAPDAPFDNLGCFSGTALVDGGRLLLMYTGVHEDAEGRTVQEQCIAQSSDGVHFEKWACNPVIGAKDLPEDGFAEDFRDPKLMKTQDGYRVLVANRGRENGRQLSFSSKDLRRWTCDGVFLENVGMMPECPDYMHADGHSLMLTSVMRLPQDGLRFQNGVNDVVYILGEEKDGRLVPQTMEAVDLGIDFYAPQTVTAPDGRIIMIAWAAMWGEDIPTHTLGHRWAGMYTLPRELTVKNGRLYQRPVREMEKYLGSGVVCTDVDVHGETRLRGISGHRFRLRAEMNVRGDAEIRLHESGDGYFSVHYDTNTHILTADRSRSGIPIAGKSAARGVVPEGTEHITLEIFADRSSVEVFANDGALALTVLTYPRKGGDGIAFVGDFRLRRVEMREITLVSAVPPVV